MKHRLFAILSASRVPLLAGALGSSLLAAYSAPSTAAAAPAASDPAAIYHNYCSVCHGDKGDGNSRGRDAMIPPPRDLTTPQAAVELSRGRMIHAVAEGRPGTAMAPWKHQLSQRQIELVVDYIRATMMLPVATMDAGRARKLYSENCSVCHGDHGNGARWTQQNMSPPPRDFTSEEVKTQLTRERMIHSVTYGRPGTAMAPYASQLPANDIELIVDYIRSGFMKLADRSAPISGTHAHGLPAGSEAAAPAPAPQPVQPPLAGPKPGQEKEYFARPYPEGLKGDRVRGLALYMSNCEACHGSSGNGRGPRAYFIFPKPRDFSHPGSRASMNRPFLYEAIAKGRLRTEMPAWDKVFTPQQIADVSEFVFQEFIRTQRSSARAP